MFYIPSEVLLHVTARKYLCIEDEPGEARRVQEEVVHPHDILLPRHVPVHSLEHLGG